jgi:hypothetical protein
VTLARCAQGSSRMLLGRTRSCCGPGRAEKAEGFEQYFRDLAGALSGGPIDPAVVAEIAQKYDIEPA